MEVIPHDAEVLYSEIIFLLGTLYSRKEQILDLIRLKDHFLAICTGAYVVARSFSQLTWLSHACYSCFVDDCD